MPTVLQMLEYLERLGINITDFVDQSAVKAEYLRKIYRLDSREKLINSQGVLTGKASNPRHLVQ
ncbi:hypothetical protein CI610_00758 [invertebrate metagenome]|uniref:Uncharacterized protein n=1 Tax=invertebrate metagenome TaxID=1711999 RepID=A0A2H9TAF7_9ZZZZ